jgi:hypothetical protein
MVAVPLLSMREHLEEADANHVGDDEKEHLMSPCERR